MKRIAALLTSLILALPPVVSHAQAQCQVLRSSVIDEAQQKDIDLIQTGLRSALQDENTLLDDGVLGPYTRIALVQLCGGYPLSGNTASVSGTLQSAREFGELEALSRNWYQLTSDPVFANMVLPTDGQDLNLKALALAGPPALTASILNNDIATADCETVTEDDLSQIGRAGALAMTAVDPLRWGEPASICSALNAPGGKSGFDAAMTSIGALETALPGSVYQVLSPDFALWLGEDINTRGPRLVGSDQVVVALVAEYRSEDRPAAPRDFTALYKDLPDSCLAPGGRRVTDYTALDDTALAQLTQTVDILGLLESLEEQSFETAADLRAAVLGALRGEVDQCTLDQVDIALTSAENFGLRFSLNEERTANLTLIESFADSAPVVAPLVGLTAQNRSTLLSGARAAIQDAVEARIDAEVELAADTLAAASEPVSEVFDSLPSGVPEFDPLELNPTIGVTEATDSAILATVEDEDFRRALLASGYVPAPNEEVLRGNVRAILAPIAADKVTAAVNRDITRLISAVDSHWSLTDTLSSAISAAPYVANAQSLINDTEALASLETVAGVEYPNDRLLQVALDELELGDAVKAEILNVSARDEGDTAVERITAVAQEDCGCVSPRAENSQVYGFFPFWMAPRAPDGAPEETEIEPDQEAVTRTIDFGLVSRAAFYGLELVILDETAPPENRIVLLNESTWKTAERDFVNGAHQHRAKADLAVKLTGWDTWTDREIEQTAERLAALIAPFNRIDETSWDEIGRAFPTLLDRPQADGLTLIVDGYDGSVPVFPNIEKLEDLIDALSAILEPRDQTINLGFDMTLSSQPGNISIFEDLHRLLVSGPSTRTESDLFVKRDKPAVDLVLVFLERPTTNTKKLLRSRMERGPFKGEDRAAVLRRIIPVLPPGGHRNVLQSQSQPSAEAPAPFSQFDDDLIYFQDNFGGVGFWPSPDPEAEDFEDIEAIFEARWLNRDLPAVFSPYQENFDAMCTFICPNRTAVAGIALIVFVLTALVVWRSFYSGLAERIAYKFGLAWAGGLGLFSILLSLTVCDPVALWPPIFLYAMIAGAVLLVGFHFYQSAQNGPKP